MRVLENRVERKIFGHKRDEVTGERRVIYRVLVGKPSGKRPLGRPMHTWKDNIKLDLQEVGCGGVDWIEPAQDRYRWYALVHAVMNRCKVK
jgi:hypothetical protein